MGAATEDPNSDRQCVSFIETYWLNPVSFETGTLLQVLPSISAKLEIVNPTGAQIPNFI